MPRTKPNKTINLSPEDEESLIKLAKAMGLVWGGKGSISKLMERIAVLSRAYPDRFPLPTKLADYLASKSQEGDKQAQDLLEDLESYSLDRMWEEVVSEGVIKIKKGGGWIV